MFSAPRFQVVMKPFRIKDKDGVILHRLDEQAERSPLWRTIS